MKRLIFSIIAISLALSSFAAKRGNTDTEEKTYNILVNIPEMKNDTVYLGFYYNGKTYSKDTAILNNKGTGAFTNKDKKKKEKLKEGIYMIYFNSDKFFDVLIGNDQDFKISIFDTNVKLKEGEKKKETEIKVQDAIESMKFQGLINFMTEKREEQKVLSKRYKDKQIDSTSYMEQSKKLNDEVTSFQENEIKTTEGTFYSAFLKGTIPVETPEMKEMPDSSRQMARYHYAKNHYFDNVSLNNPWFLHTPYFPNKVDTYISKYVIQHPDSIIASAVDLIERSKGNDETFQTMTSKMINYGLQSKIMGMDKVWLAIADKYYFSGQATWADSSWVEDLRKEADKIRYNLIGMQAHNLMARDSNDNVVQLRDLPQDLVLVYFYEPSCGHCKKTTPVLHDSVYVKYKDLGFEVFAFYTQTDKAEWQEFLKKHNLMDWTNVWDPHRESWFWKYYDASSTPGIYLLDKDRKFIAKKIDMNTLDMILNEELIKRKKK
ncbi:MAG: thioredoxin-like domain-containing protein [Paludibacteraceae bacterium]|nr:DUF5106 domain-containing protein [Prevotellaceae bacterium]